MEKKIALVTGGTSGIGLAAAELLREKGIRVYTLSRRETGDPLHLAADIGDEAAVKAAADTVLAREGRIDILVNCAGFGISGPAELTPASLSEKQLRVNLIGTANAVNAVLPAMRKQGGGRIVLLSSVASVVPIPFQTWYSVSKAGIDAYTMALGNEVRPFGVSVCAVRPGDTKTGFTAAREKLSDPSGVYTGRLEKSVSRMEHDEQTGVDPKKVAALIVRAALKKRVHPFYTPGFGYQMAGLLMKLLPAGAANRLIALLYG